MALSKLETKVKPHGSFLKMKLVEWPKTFVNPFSRCAAFMGFMWFMSCALLMGVYCRFAAFIEDFAVGNRIIVNST
jgi:hypothetical protein